MNNYDLTVDNHIWKLFTGFFREIKGYREWTDDEINLSQNNDDIVDFVEWLTSLKNEEQFTMKLSIVMGSWDNIVNLIKRLANAQSTVLLSISLDIPKCDNDEVDDRIEAICEKYL